MSCEVSNAVGDETEACVESSHDRRLSRCYRLEPTLFSSSSTTSSSLSALDVVETKTLFSSSSSPLSALDVVLRNLRDSQQALAATCAIASRRWTSAARHLSCCSSSASLHSDWMAPRSPRCPSPRYSHKWYHLCVTLIPVKSKYCGSQGYSYVG